MYLEQHIENCVLSHVHQKNNGFPSLQKIEQSSLVSFKLCVGRVQVVFCLLQNILNTEKKHRVQVHVSRKVLETA